MSVVEIILIVCILGSLIADYIIQRNLTSRIEKIERQVSVGAHCEDGVLDTEGTIDYLKRIGNYDAATSKQKAEELDYRKVNPEDLVSRISGASEEFADERLKESGFVEQKVSLVGSNYPMWYTKRIYKCGKIRITTDISGGRVIRATLFE